MRATARLPIDRPPVWFMRQAGRYLPEYRQLKERHGFLKMVRTPELACEVTLQPLRRYRFDAAILFSDILTVPEALGFGYSFAEGGGIRMQRRVESAADIAGMDPLQVADRLAYVGAALRLLSCELSGSRALLGFSGAPWTLAAYLIEGAGAEGFPRFLRLAHEAPEVIDALLEKLEAAIIAYLRLQIEAGADAVQLFDSWAGLCPGGLFERWCAQPAKRILAGIGGTVPTVLFSKGAGAHLHRLAATGASVLGADVSMDLAGEMARHPNIAWQGNLDPVLMELEPEVAAAAMRDLLQATSGRSGHIVNLGHGLRPLARPETVGAAVEAAVGFQSVPGFNPPG